MIQILILETWTGIVARHLTKRSYEHCFHCHSLYCIDLIINLHDSNLSIIESTCSALVKNDEKNHSANLHEVDIRNVVAEELSEANDRLNKRCNLVIFNISEDRIMLN